jgi:hypothetical protein
MINAVQSLATILLQLSVHVESSQPRAVGPLHVQELLSANTARLALRPTQPPFK